MKRWLYSVMAHHTINFRAFFLFLQNFLKPKTDVTLPSTFGGKVPSVRVHVFSTWLNCYMIILNIPYLNNSQVQNLSGHKDTTFWCHNVGKIWKHRPSSGAIPFHMYL
jgi:hypothetical protein